MSRLKQVLSEMDNFKTAAILGLSFVGVGVWLGTFQNAGLAQMGAENRAAIDSVVVHIEHVEQEQAIFAEDEVDFRKTITDELVVTREDRVRENCRKDVLGRTDDRARARRECYGTTVRTVPLEDLIARGY